MNIGDNLRFKVINVYDAEGNKLETEKGARLQYYDKSWKMWRDIPSTHSSVYLKDTVIDEPEEVKVA